MGEGAYIYLFKHDNGGLWKSNIQQNISEYSSTDDNYAYQLVKKYKKLLQEHEMENRQLKLQLQKTKGGKRGLKSPKSTRKVTGKNEDKKMKKKMEDLEQKSVDQETEIRRLDTKLRKIKQYANELESEKMQLKNVNLMQKLKIKELQSRLYELEGDAQELDDIESFLRLQEKVTAKQDAAMEAVGVTTPGTPALN